MALPLHTITPASVVSPYLWGAEMRSTPTESWEMGGDGIADPSGGLTSKLWHGVLDTESGAVLLSAPGVPEIVLYSDPGITQMDFCFDQNMQPNLAFTKSGRAYFWWYRTATQSYETLDLGAGAITPLAILDDKRDGLATYSDVLLFYVRGTSVYYREQRDNYAVEYHLCDGVIKLLRVGFSKGLRVQLQVLI